MFSERTIRMRERLEKFRDSIPFDEFGKNHKNEELIHLMCYQDFLIQYLTEDLENSENKNSEDTYIRERIIQELTQFNISLKNLNYKNYQDLCCEFYHKIINIIRRENIRRRYGVDN